MPEEARRFASVDGVCKNTVAKCMADPKVLTFTRSEGLLDNLKTSFDLLELINKGLNAYLEQKRYAREALNTLFPYIDQNYAAGYIFRGSSS